MARALASIYRRAIERSQQKQMAFEAGDNDRNETRQVSEPSAEHPTKEGGA